MWADGTHRLHVRALQWHLQLGGAHRLHAHRLHMCVLSYSIFIRVDGADRPHARALHWGYGACRLHVRRLHARSLE